MSRGPSPNPLGHQPQPRSCMSPPHQQSPVSRPYLCSSGDWLGDAHLNPAPCGRGRAVSRGHRPGVPPPATPLQGQPKRAVPSRPHRIPGERHAKPAPNQHPGALTAPLQPAGHNEAFIGAQSHPHICSALAPRFDVSPRRTPPHAVLWGGPGHRGALLWSQSRVFSCKIPPPGPDNVPVVEGVEAWAGGGTGRALQDPRRRAGGDRAVPKCPSVAAGLWQPRRSVADVTVSCASRVARGPSWWWLGSTGSLCSVPRGCHQPHGWPSRMHPQAFKCKTTRIRCVHHRESCRLSRRAPMSPQ